MNPELIAENAAKVHRMMRQREKEKAEVQKKRSEIENDTLKKTTTHIKDKFGGSTADVLDEEFKNNTVGLLTKEDFRLRREQAGSLKQDAARKHQELKEQEDKKVYMELLKKRKAVEKLKSTLSFGEDEELQDQEQEEIDPALEGDKILKRRNLGKNPYVDTSFLPDKEREEKEEELKKQLKEEYIRQQEIIKEQLFEVSYSYWDGLTNIKTIKVKKNTKISTFLEICRKELANEYPDLRAINSDFLLLVINDALVPATVTFYELLVGEIESKYGRVLTLEERAGDCEVATGKPFKIVDKRWYDKHKHIYPCTIWDPLDPNKIQP